MDADGVYWWDPPDVDSEEKDLKSDLGQYGVERGGGDYDGQSYGLGELGHPCIWWPVLFCNSITETEQQRFNAAVASGEQFDFSTYSGSFKSLCVDAEHELRLYRDGKKNILFELMVTMAKISGEDARAERKRWPGYDKRLDDIRLPELPDEFIGTDSEDEEEEEMMRAYLALHGIYV